MFLVLNFVVVLLLLYKQQTDTVIMFILYPESFDIPPFRKRGLCPFPSNLGRSVTALTNTMQEKGYHLTSEAR